MREWIEKSKPNRRTCAERDWENAKKTKHFLYCLLFSSSLYAKHEHPESPRFSSLTCRTCSLLFCLFIFSFVYFNVNFNGFCFWLCIERKGANFGVLQSRGAMQKRRKVPLGILLRRRFLGATICSLIVTFFFFLHVHVSPSPIHHSKFSDKIAMVCFLLPYSLCFFRPKKIRFSLLFRWFWNAPLFSLCCTRFLFFIFLCLIFSYYLGILLYCSYDFFHFGLFI